jgi:porphobilinogen deaminase
MKKIINSVNEKLESLILKYKDSIDEANNKIVGELNAQHKRLQNIQNKIQELSIDYRNLEQAILKDKNEAIVPSLKDLKMSCSEKLKLSEEIKKDILFIIENLHKEIRSNNKEFRLFKEKIQTIQNSFTDLCKN